MNFEPISAKCNKMRHINFMIFSIIAFLYTTPSGASLILNQNRVVFPASETQVAIVKVDNPTSNDFLMQSWVEDKDGKPQEDIFVDPPLAKIKSGHKIALRLTTINPQLASGNKEQLYWLNVKEIPKQESSDAGSHMAIVVRSRIKVLYRPKSINPWMDNMYTHLEWRHTADGISVHNPTPYHITFNNIWYGDNEKNSIDMDMIAPGADIKINNNRLISARKISFKIINDFGDTTEAVAVKIN